MKKRKSNLPSASNAPEEPAEAALPVPRTWATMKKRPHAMDAPEKPAASAKRKKDKNRAVWINKSASMKNPQQALEEKQFVSSLTEPELGLLISLKQLVERRAETIKQSTLANKFDLRILRALGFVLLEHFKEECKKASILPDTAETSSGFNQCSLVTQNIESSAVSPGAVTCDEETTLHFLTPPTK